MPKNRFLYIGILIIAACALLKASAWILARVEWALLPTAIFGAVLIVVGVVLELKKDRAPDAHEPAAVRDSVV